jgi:polyhydroxyalkanoate synthesis regulator protein
MYTIKKYANGRFYDTVAKNYITRPQISALVKSGKKITIINTTTGADITTNIVSQIKSKQGKQTAKEAKTKKAKAKSGGMLAQLFRKSGDALSDYGKKYASMWQNLLTMSREEIDKLVNLLVKDNKLSEFEADKLKKELLRYRDNIQKWFTKNIDHRINDILSRMNLANRDQILKLTAKIDGLNLKIKQIEKLKGFVKSKKASPKKSSK